MLTEIERPLLIEKEEIEALTFPASEVLHLPAEIANRRSNLKQYTRLGNHHKGKVQIVFEDQEGIKSVRTTIWATTELNIILKRNSTIPIHRIHYVSV